MVLGETIALIIIKTVALFEAMLGNLVNVTNVSGNVTPSLSPDAETYAGYLSNIIEAMMRAVSTFISYLS